MQLLIPPRLSSSMKCFFFNQRLKSPQLRTLSTTRIAILLLITLLSKTTKVSAIVQRPSFGDPEAEQRLITQLLGIVKGNNTRPTSLNGRALQVNITLTLFQLIEVNQRLNMVELSGSLTMEWVDPRMSWDPNVNSNIQILHLPYTSVWKPDIYAYFGHSDDNLDERINFMVRLNSEGTNLLELPFRSNSLCPIDVKLFPFDIQQCSLTFGSWSYENKFIEFNPNDRVDLANFYDNQEWLLDQTKVAKSYLSSLKAGNFSTVTMTYRIRRQSFYYIFNLVIPATVVTVTSVIGVHAPTPFHAPRSSRFQLGIVTLLPMGVLLLTIVNDLPKFALTSVEGQRGSFSGVPLLGIFYLSQILTISFCTITYSVFVALERYGRRGHSVPWPLTWLLGFGRRRQALVKGWYYDSDSLTKYHSSYSSSNKGCMSQLCANSALLLPCIPGNNDPNEDFHHRRGRTSADTPPSIKSPPIHIPPITDPGHQYRHRPVINTARVPPVRIRKDRLFVDERASMMSSSGGGGHMPPSTHATAYNRHHSSSHHHTAVDIDNYNDNNITNGGGRLLHISPKNNENINNNIIVTDHHYDGAIKNDLSGGRGGRQGDYVENVGDVDEESSLLKRRKMEMYEQWEIVIGRLEWISLGFFLFMSAVIVLAFFFHDWR